MSLSIWATLGIEATRERKDIRRAYAAKLKTTHPEDDPAGFQTLRIAYERALSYAGPERRVAVVRREPEPEPEVAIEVQVEVETEPVDELAITSDGDERSPREHDHRWRPADEGSDEGVDEPAKRGPRQWRAPPPKPVQAPPKRVRTHRPPPPQPAEDPAVEDAYKTALYHLQHLISLPATSPGDLVAALKALLASPGMESIDRHAQTEARLATMIPQHSPRSDVLIPDLIAYFRWDEGRVGPRFQLGARVLARRDDLRFLAIARQPGARNHGALRFLTRPPTLWRRLSARLTFDLASRVPIVLATIRTERPGLLDNLNSDAVAWWDRRLAKPYFGPASLWVLILLPAVLAFFAMGAGTSNPSTPAWLVWLVSLGMTGAAASFNLYAIQWPRRLWRTRWMARAPPWVRWAWAPLLAGLLLVSSVVPPTTVSRVVIDVLDAVALLWVMIVGDPDRRPGVRYPWVVRALFSFVYLIAFWLAAPIFMRPDIYWTMSAPIAAGIVGFTLGEGTLIGAWHAGLSERARRWGLIALGAATAAVLALLLAAGRDRSLAPFAMALLAAVVLAHKAPAAGLTGALLRVRHYVMVYGWLGWFIFAAAFEGSRASPLEIGGFWLISGVALTAAQVLVRPGQQPAPKRR